MEAGAIIRKSKEYIEKHIDEVLTVAKIAGAVGYSEYHFSRIFRQETGVSVMEYVKSEKLRRASGDIRNGAKIVDTAVKYGWESHNGFTKAFKKRVWLLPGLTASHGYEYETVRRKKYERGNDWKTRGTC